MRLRILIATIVLSFLTAACAPPPSPLSTSGTPSAAMDHKAIFEKRIEKVGDRVFCAIGYALSNCAMIGVDGGKVIVDATEDLEAAKTIRAEFDKLWPGPVLALVYTHTHPDHIMGADAFLDPGTEVIAQAKAPAKINEQFASLGKTLRMRASRQFGVGLPENLSPTAGIGLALRLDDKPIPPLVYPTVTFDQTLDRTFGNVKVQFVAAPGETHDQLFIYLPGKKILFSGDNIYQAFPNLYSTRGVPPRPVHGWIESLDKMRALKPEALVPGHTGVIEGVDRVYETLTIYRDAIAFVHDSVIRMTNEGKSPDDMVQAIRLPERMRAHPYLQEHYGKVSWSVRGIYDGYLGWFDGNPTSLGRLHPKNRAEKLLPLLGGKEKVLVEARTALNSNDPQWAAELADLVLAVKPKDKEAKSVKADALWRLGESDFNANARSYYFTSALALRGEWEDPPAPKYNSTTLRDVPMKALLSTMPQRVDPDETKDEETAFGFSFPDTGNSYTLVIRKGVGEFREGLAGAKATMIVSESDFKKIIAGELGGMGAYADGKVKIDGSFLEMMGFQDFLIKE
jgi:alkyl sulfatase BDS1-like metallo-beta-lactamase superfamily hydrolase